ncbi:hypothetical protein PENSPDRAFT_257402 [Peniophora sp. CONT]|nr:hypothetical protein PENSPDRAFT_257402 [Peniophora sp. CONT]
MDPSQPPRSLKRKSRSPPSPSSDRVPRIPPPPGAAHAPQAAHTSLPSIHSLYLGASQTVPPQTYPDERHAYPHATVPMPLPSGVPIASGSNRDLSHSDTGMVMDPFAPHGGADSDFDEGEQGNRPKQKRRRQALSCTECKRRKIKCDRAHPCGPCTRRGDQAKCQWHVIEPVDKYVSRSEFDDLKARFDRLEAVVGRMQQGMINAAGPAPGDLSTGSSAAAIFAPQLADRGTYPPAAFNQPVAGPSHRTDPESAYAAVEAYRNPTQSPITSSAYSAPFPSRTQQQQRASSPAQPPAMLPPSEQGSSPSGYITARRPSGSEMHFAGRVPGRSPPMPGGSSILAPPPQGYMHSPSRALPPSLGGEPSEHPSQTPGDVRSSSRRASTASITAPPRPHGAGPVPQLPPPPGGERDPRYRER